MAPRRHSDLKVRYQTKAGPTPRVDTIPAPGPYDEPLLHRTTPHKNRAHEDFVRVLKEAADAYNAREARSRMTEPVPPTVPGSFDHLNARETYQ